MHCSVCRPYIPHLDRCWRTFVCFLGYFSTHQSGWRRSARAAPQAPVTRGSALGAPATERRRRAAEPGKGHAATAHAQGRHQLAGLAVHRGGPRPATRSIRRPVGTQQTGLFAPLRGQAQCAHNIDGRGMLMFYSHDEKSYVG